MAKPTTEQQQQTYNELMAAILTLGRLLPVGMSVSFYRNDDDPRAIVESVYPNGEVTHHFFNQILH